jgi:hypothetical protein
MGKSAALADWLLSEPIWTSGPVDPQRGSITLIPPDNLGLLTFGTLLGLHKGRTELPAPVSICIVSMTLTHTIMICRIGFWKFKLTRPQ